MPMNLSVELEKISNPELHERTVQMARKEQQATIDLLYHIQEVNRRKLYAERGFGSLWEYIVKALNYSESQASERLSAMRLIFRVREAKEALEAGTLGLTQAAMTERHIRAEEKEKGSELPKTEIKALVEQVQSKSKRETEKILLSLRPQETPTEKIRQVNVDTSEVRFPVSEETRKLMEQYWELKGRCSISEVFSACLQFYVEHKTLVKKEGRTPKRLFPEKVGNQSRYIPVSVKQMVRERSGGTCEFVDPINQRRCESRYLLQFDHIHPFSWGGASDSTNLRILCSAHNQYLGKEMLRKGPLELFDS